MAIVNRDGVLDRAALRVSYFEARAKANKHLFSLDPERLPDGLDSKDIDGAREFARRLAAWATAFEDALPRGLRVLRAETAGREGFSRFCAGQVARCAANVTDRCSGSHAPFRSASAR